MSKALKIIIAAVVLVLVIAAGVAIKVFFGGSLSGGWNDLSTESSYSCSWKSHGKDCLILRIKGDFPQGTFSVEESNSAAITTKEAASYNNQLQLKFTGNSIGTKNIKLSRVDDEQKVDVFTATLIYDGESLALVDFDYSSSNGSTTISEIEGLTYTATCVGDTVTVRIENGSNQPFEIETEYTKVLDIVRELDTSDVSGDEKSEASSKDKGQGDGAVNSTATDTETSGSVAYVMTAKQAGTEIVRICSTELNSAIELFVVADNNLNVSLENCETIEYTYSGAESFNEMGELLVGSEMYPKGIEFTGYAIDHQGIVLHARINSVNWDYKVMLGIPVEQALEYQDSSARQVSGGTVDNTEYLIYSSEDGTSFFAAFSFEGNTCLVYNENGSTKSAVESVVKQIIGALVSAS